MYIIRDICLFWVMDSRFKAIFLCSGRGVGILLWILIILRLFSLFFRAGRVIGILILRLLRLFLCSGSGIPFSQGFFITLILRLFLGF